MRTSLHACTRFLRANIPVWRATSIFLLFLGLSTLSAQSPGSPLWQDISQGTLKNNTGNRTATAGVFRLLSLDFEKMKNAVKQAPMESSGIAVLSKVRILLPLPDGKMHEYMVVESPVMAPELIEKYPDVRTFTVQSVDFDGGSGRVDITQFGFHAMLFTPLGTVFIDPYRLFDVNIYQSYFVRDYTPGAKSIHMGNCLEDNAEARLEIDRIVNQPGFSPKIGNQLRTYRLALATTAEYTAYFGGTVDAAYSAMVTTMNRVNQVYINDLCIKMVLVANTTNLIYTNSSTDPYTNSSGSTMLTQNQTNIDNVIGTANYDIGHVFSTGGGGIAGLGVVCRSGQKAKGVTGSSAPTGDPYDIDYVAHEMGHQFGGNHTFNSTTSSCGGGNRNASTAYENGSGTTIMAYAGICGADNLQSNSDPYFHTKSIDEIVAYSNTGSGNNCPVVTSTGNTAPVLTMPTGGYALPVSTPFSLTASATDADGDALTYCWEEFDLGASGTVGAPSGDAPIFRSFNPASSPTRFFPKLTSIINNTSTFGEMLPTYARNLNFRCTVRDNKTVGGGVVSGTVSFTVSAAAGPFTVTAPNTAVSFAGLSTQTVTWNVANTSASPVNCANVKILLSTDGGNTFPVTLAASTANDGSESVTIPNTATATARIKVEAIGNIFFDMSNANFTITQSSSGTVSLTSPAGGEHWQSGSAKTINWSSTGVTNVKLEYSTNAGSAWVQIAASTPAAAGSYLWLLPAAASTQALVRITDVVLSSVGDTSAAFTIAALALTAPAGGEGWKAGSQKSITWTSQNIADVKIEYSSNNGSAWTTISGSTPAALGTYLWTVPATASTQNLVRMSDAAYPAIADTTNPPFRITTLALTAPAGGEDWKAGTQKTISWTSQNISTVKLEFSANNGADWNLITAAVSGALGSYSWTVPFSPSSACLVRASDSANSTTYSVNAAPFTITAPYMITSVQSPSSTGQGMLSFDSTNILLNLFVKSVSPITVNYFPNEEPLAGGLPSGIVGVSRYYWSIAGNNIVFQSGVISIPLDKLRGVNYPQNLVWLKRSLPGDAWANIGGTIADASLKSTVPFSFFSEFAIGTSDTLNPLPVELESFVANVKRNAVHLTWSTATENNNAGFDVERAAVFVNPGNEKREWKKIGFVPGSGNSFSRKEYSFTDDRVQMGKYMYRLKQVDNDGSFSFSFQVQADLGVPAAFVLLQNYPNPFNPSTTISFTLAEKSAALVVVYNQLGEKVATLLNGTFEPGLLSVEWDAAKVPSGIYFYELRTENFRAMRKLVLMK